MNNTNNLPRRIAVMFFGLVLMGLGIAIFKVSLMGNDPSTAMVMAIGDKIGVPFSVVLLVANALWFVAEIVWGRRYIGIGTFANWFGVGTLASLWIGGINRLFTVPEAFLPRLFILAVGVLVLSLSVSLYQTADLGIAPYDVLSILLSKKTPIPYFWCRILTDSICTAVAFLFGGLIGLGTLVCALGLGPFIAFFSKHVAAKLVQE